MNFKTREKKGRIKGEREGKKGGEGREKKEGGRRARNMTSGYCNNFVPNRPNYSIL